MATLLIAATAVSTTTTTAYAQVASPTTTFVNVDLSSTANPNDHGFGMECTDPQFAYLTIYHQGIIAKVDKITKAVSLIQNPEGPQAAGRGFYSIARDPSTGNLFVNESFNGKIWRLNPSTETWTPAVIVPEITGNPKITYPLGYLNKPNVIQVDENPGPHGVHTYGVAMQSFGGLVYAGNSIYVGLQYDVDFDSEAETLAGATDMAFSGLAKVDPSTLAVTRIAIPGSIMPSAMTVDSQNNNIIWISDNDADKLVKFDTTIDTVTETVTLAADSSPRGLDDDASFLYVALEKPGSVGTNSTILRLDKANTASQAIIDTGAPNTFLGTFSVYMAGPSLLAWTDGSAHVGTVNLGTGAKSYQDTNFASENRFGCLVGSEFWWNGHGSVKVGMMELPQDAGQQQPVSVMPAPATNDGNVFAVFFAPAAAMVANISAKDVPRASEPYDYMHNGIRAYVEYVHFSWTVDHTPGLENLDDYQKAWLFHKIKPELDRQFSWLPE